MKHLINSLLIVLFISSCNTKKQDPLKPTATTKTELKTLSKGEIIINEAIKAHGGALYDAASYSFIFRKKEYSFANNGDEYKYEVRHKSEAHYIHDILENGILTRTINDKQVDLNSKQIKEYTGALNSVIYFATLPHKLNDNAVIKKHKGSCKIKGIDYNSVEITFKKEGGGQDHDDVFYYWVNSKTKTIDYLAYSYNVNGGGVRFRSAYNAKTVEGIRFQDYINYKASFGTPLKNLPALYEKNELKELSRIETENIINLNK